MNLMRVKQFLFLNYLPSSGGTRGGLSVTVDVDEGVTGSIFIGSDTDSCEWDGDGTEIKKWKEKSQIVRQNYFSIILNIIWTWDNIYSLASEDGWRIDVGRGTSHVSSDDFWSVTSIRGITYHKDGFTVIFL